MAELCRHKLPEYSTTCRCRRSEDGTIIARSGLMFRRFNELDVLRGCLVSWFPGGLHASFQSFCVLTQPSRRFLPNSLLRLAGHHQSHRILRELRLGLPAQHECSHPCLHGLHISSSGSIPTRSPELSGCKPCNISGIQDFPPRRDRGISVAILRHVKVFQKKCRFAPHSFDA
jgi:hypothetical protein